MSQLPLLGLEVRSSSTSTNVFVSQERTRWLGYLVSLFIALALSGCAASVAFRDGQELIADGKIQQGLTKLEEAVKLDPRNVEYRVTLVNRRTSALNRELAHANESLLSGDLKQAQRSYLGALALEPNNYMALQGLRAVREEERILKRLSEASALIERGDADSVVRALDTLRSVLAEAPGHSSAARLFERASALRRDLVRESGQLAMAYRKPIDLVFNDAPVRSVFEVIAQVSGLKFYFDNDVRQDLRVTTFIKGRSIEEAIRTILSSHQLEQQVIGSDTVLIYSATPQKLREYQTLLVRTFYITNADVKAVSAALKTIAKVRDLSVDERLNAIIVRDTPEAIRVAEKIVTVLDLVDPEVMLEVEILEVKRSKLQELGIQWPGSLTLSPIAAGKVLSLADLKNLNTGSVQATMEGAVLKARKEDQDGTTLANPRIRVRNREKAKILIGDRVPVISNTSTSTGFVAESVNYLDVGLKLEVEPAVYGNEIGIKINLEVSTLVKEISSKAGSLVYQIGTRGASTTLRLQSGETQILAGLISDEERSTSSKIPAVGELPLVGRLFGTQKDDGQRTELLLSITPRIMRSVQRPDFSVIEFDSGTEARIGSPVSSVDGRP